jgi:hypothetical protein
MIKKISFSILLWLSATTLLSQIKNDTIFYESKNIDNIPKYIINDGIYYKWQWNKRSKDYVLFKDTLQLPLRITQNFDNKTYFFNNHSQILYSGNSYGYYSFDFKKDTITTVTPDKEETNFVMVDAKLYFSNYKTLYIKDLKTGKIIDSLTIMSKDPYDYILKIIKFSNTNEVVLMMGYYDGGEIPETQYYVYNEISKKYSLAPNNDLMQKIIEPNSAIVRFYDLPMQHIFLDKFIFDSNFNLLSKFKYHGIDIYGFVLSNQIITQLIIKSNVDSENGKKEGNKVLIPFIPNPFKEKAIYEIYENIELKAEDLEQFDAFDLRILRNMIFAKHNYAFKDKFLQAYFNLYGFYSANSKKNRLTDVSHLLTPEDKKNLELIEQVSKKK